MKKKSECLAFALLGVLLLALATYRTDAILKLPLGTFLTKVMVAAGVLLLAVYSGKMIKISIKWTLLALTSVELLVAAGYITVANRRCLGGFVQAFMQDVHLDRGRNIIQCNTECGRFDSLTFYTLKPGTCHFKNWEFNTTVEVNSLGFRDDEASLDFPKVIFLGDSFTMGWGTEQQASFPQLVESSLRLKCLNLGISSFGTAREYLSFSKVKSDSCRLIVWQYGPFDDTENAGFVSNEFHLEISSVAEYEQTVRWNTISKSYYPLKYTYSTGLQLLHKTKLMLAAKRIERSPSVDLSDASLKNFFAIISKFKETFTGKILIVGFESYHPSPALDAAFARQLKEQPIKDVYFLPAATCLEQSDFFAIDNHLNPAGHQKIARCLLDFIQKNHLLE